MCSQTICRTCQKPTWAGCGAHVEQALANVPYEQRCHCRDAGVKPAAQATPAQTARPASSR